ncbi:hypothetical protein PENSPDRAFT_717139 [Peniophora sp. CONT]|nr:hypothetical protein PENSPDRAFT_717139 [Peniophora sp. CONT]
MATPLLICALSPPYHCFHGKTKLCDGFKRTLYDGSAGMRCSDRDHHVICCCLCPSDPCSSVQPSVHMANSPQDDVQVVAEGDGTTITPPDPSTNLSEDSPQVTFTTLWAAALFLFKQRTDVQPDRWKNLLNRMEPCKTAEDVCAVFDQDMHALARFRGADSSWGRLRRGVLKPAIEVLLLFNDAIAEVAAAFPAVPGGKAIFVAFGVLLEATKGVTAYLEALRYLFEDIQAFLEGLRVRLALPASFGPATQKIAITILAHILDVCLCATKVLSKRPWLGRLAIYGKLLTKDADVRDALQRMRRLSTMESHAVVVETRVEMSNVQAVTSETRDITIKNHVSTNKLLRREAAAAQSRSLIGRSVDKLLQGQKDMLEFLRAERREYTAVDATRVIQILNPVLRADIEAQAPDGCMKGTRVRILKDLRAWSRDSAAPQIFWLNGMAGTGKSAVARSFCHILRQDGLLGGSFFCSRGGSVEEGNVQRIIPTLAASMSKGNTAFNQALLTLLQREPFSIQWNVQLQIERLLCGPLDDAQNKYGIAFPIFVIDALDECADGYATRDLLVRLVRLSGSLNAKFFLTSRPEAHLRSQLESMDPRLGKVLRLHDIERDIVRADISLYLTNELRAMRELTFPPKWPLKADIAVLTRLSDKLFIYAFTALQYLRRDPVSRLKKLTGTAVVAGRPMTKPLDDIYNLILSEAMDPDLYEVDEIEMSRAIIANIVTMREPLSVEALSKLLSLPVDQIKSSINRLYAVIYVPIRDDNGALSTFHASFGDFVTDHSRAPQYMDKHILKSHRALAMTCLDALQSDRLCFNVSQALTSYLPNSEQQLALFSDSFRYACLHWGHHIASGHNMELLTSLERVFVGPKFLFWLEVLSSLGLSEKATDILAIVQSIRDMSDRLTRFLKDATAFVNDFGHIVVESTPHIYLSALSRCDPASFVAQCCLPYFTNLPRISLQSPGSALSIRPTYVTYSPDGKHIIVGMNDGSIHTYDARTGIASMRPRIPHRQTVHVTFSSDGSLMASGTPECVLQIRETQKGKLIWELQGHVGLIRAVDFSQDGSLVVSGSMDHCVCLWAIRTGQQVVPPLRGHTDTVLSVAFSRSGMWIVSGSADAQIRVWDTALGTNIQTYSNHHNNAICSIICSPDGKRVASGSDDGTICIWDINTGRLVMKPLEASAIWSINFSPDGSRLVTASYDRIYVWDLQFTPSHKGEILGNCTDWRLIACRWLLEGNTRNGPCRLVAHSGR